MASRFNGPLLGKATNEGARTFFSNCPIQFDPDFYYWMDDYNEVADATNVYVVVKDAGASVAIVGDVLNGEVLLSSTATTDDDGGTIQTQSEVVTCTSGKKFWYEARVKISDATQMDMFVGLCQNVATNPENVLTDQERIGFQKNDGSTAILTKTDTGGSSTSTTTSSVMAAATYVKLGIHYDGISKVKFYVNRSLVASHTTNLTTALLAPTLFELSGDASGTKTMTCDYQWLAVER